MTSPPDPDVSCANRRADLQLRVHVEEIERGQIHRAAVLGVVWQREVAEERTQRERERRRLRS
jgi:hypothetical protein